TTIVPHRPVARLLTGGPYGLTRNPMYTGLAMAYLGGALLAGTWLPLVFLPLALLCVRRLVIDPEERYLRGRFGADYAAYQARVRRWL
ncbi:MAG: isoprenylcysteine carboxylmethyltransferase family protein, partial [Actinomycetota bacterium]|nr:isoprenylcysteine carboxylmethyltransferase family protein [Actinomycetota bacterium]